MQKSNFHNHTTYSDGHLSVRGMIEVALANGFTALGISDHSYAAGQESYCMTQEGTRESYAEVKSLAAEYAGQIAVYSGIELDAQSADSIVTHDYVISSLHELVCGGLSIPVDISAKVQLDMIKMHFGKDPIRLAERYYGELAEHIAKNRTDIVGHFDLITKYSLISEDNAHYMDIALSALRDIMKSCTVFELNTGAIARQLRKTPYPAPFILHEIKKLGGRIIITSDCHYGERMTCWFNEAESYLASAGFCKNNNSVLNKTVRGIEMWE